MVKNIGIVTQARINSSRFSGKILKKIANETLLSIHLKRIQMCKTICKKIVATTNEPRSNQIENISKKENFKVYKGSNNNVLKRFYYATFNENLDYVVRLTSDCPLIDPSLIDEIVKYSINKNLDYCSNTLIETYPDGQDIEVFKFSSLETAFKRASKNSEFEHVTPYIKKHSSFYNEKLFISESYNFDLDYSNFRMTVDEPEDLDCIKILIKNCGKKASWLDYSKYIRSNIEKFSNQNIQRNQGYYNSLKND
jgi:spore coat polysaccharide biosynthesis protein SpsF (cytidylyltransferase family)